VIRCHYIHNSPTHCSNRGIVFNSSIGTFTHAVLQWAFFCLWSVVSLIQSRFIDNSFRTFMKFATSNHRYLKPRFPRHLADQLKWPQSWKQRVTFLHDSWKSMPLPRGGGEGYSHLNDPISLIIIYLHLRNEPSHPKSLLPWCDVHWNDSSWIISISVANCV